MFGSYGGLLGFVSKVELVFGVVWNFNFYLCFFCCGGFGGVRDFVVMEFDDIWVVMMRVSELYVNICDVIERVNKLCYLGKWLLYSFGDDGEEYDDEDVEVWGNL